MKLIWFRNDFYINADQILYIESCKGGGGSCINFQNASVVVDESPAEIATILERANVATILNKAYGE